MSLTKRATIGPGKKLTRKEKQKLSEAHSAKVKHQQAMLTNKANKALECDIKKRKVALDAKLVELCIEIDQEAEKTRRFKSLMSVPNKEGTVENIYYNDGTLDGMFVIAFETEVNYGEADPETGVPKSIEIKTTFS